jgi:hypothetical protein
MKIFEWVLVIVAVILLVAVLASLWLVRVPVF